MDQPQPFNEKQRAAFARLVEEAKKREAEELESDDTIDDRVEAEILPQLVREAGATTLVAKVRKLRKELKQADEALGKLGFDCDEDSISLKWRAPKAPREALAKAKCSARKKRDEALKRYDRAILDVWAAEDARTAKQVVEGLL